MISNVTESTIPSARTSPRGTVWFHRATVIVVAVLCWMGGQAQTRVAALPEHVDIRALDYPVQLDGVSVQSPDELTTRIGTRPIGAAVELEDADGRTLRVDATEAFYSPWHIWITRVNGLFFLAVSLVVFASRVHVVPGRDLFWACLLYGLAVMIGGVHMPPSLARVEVVLPVLRILSLVALPILLLHVGLTFPRRARVFERLPWLFPSVIAIGAVIAVWQSVAWLMWLHPDTAVPWSAVTPTQKAAAIFLAVVFGSGCLALVRGARSTRSDREREQVKWVLVGIALGAVPYVFLHTLPRALDLPWALPVTAARLFSVVIPIAFSFAVIRHRFLDVDIVIRRSLLYLVLASLMVGVYSLLGIFAGQRVVERWPQADPFVPIVATLVSALLFNPTRRVIGRAIDRVFFKIQFETSKALELFRRELGECEDQRAIASRLAIFLARELAPRRFVVVLRHATETFAAGDPVPEGATPPVDESTPSLIARSGATGRTSAEAMPFPAVWVDAGFVLAHRIDTQADHLGYVALGETENDRRYLGEELDLLTQACREVAIRLERVNLQQEIVDGIVARHRTEEMSRFRTDFFAQFAHDLRSPLTSISWSARNLLDGVVGPVTPAQTEYLDGIEGSARQLVRLVNNLLEVTRLESGGPEIELVPLALRDVVGESAAKLRVTAAAKDVTIDLDDGREPAILGHPEKLVEVVDNLLENAIRYSPPEAAVDVRLFEADERVALEIGDRGPGLDPDGIEDLFEPYRQGAASPYSTQHGFGLGLFVVRSWVERMGGTVRGTNRDGGGAVFRVELPLAVSAGKETNS